MGAEPWDCRVPYQADLTKALAEAQRETFRRGDYRRPFGDLEFLDESGFFEADGPQQETMLSEYNLDALRPVIAQVGRDGLRQRLLELQAAPTLESLEDVRALNCLDTDGTCSVIDVNGIGDVQEPCVAAPLSPNELRRLYGTDKPTLAQVEAYTDLNEDIGRGEANYVIAYRDGEPSEIYFAGYSYD